MILPDKIIFMDIETVPAVYRFDELDEATRELWEEKMRFRIDEDTDAASLYNDRGGILAEFARVICVTLGLVYREGSDWVYRSKTLYNDDEKALLETLHGILEKSGERAFLCAHNGKEFDFPFLCRRMLIHGIALPEVLDIQGKKPWEVRHLDTMEMWKFGDRKNFTSLRLLAHVFQIPSPKDDISGADVARVFYEENNLERIAQYCEKDTLTVARLYMKLQGLPPLKKLELEWR